MTITRPALRWHGGKYLLAPWIVSHFPDHRIYVEPFGGGGSVLLRKPRAYAEVYNDLDGEVVNLFRVLRDEGARLRDLVALTPFARDEFELAYRPCADNVERARRLLARSFMGFGSNAHQRKSGFRANSNRSGTTPAADWRNYFEALPAIIDRLRGVVIENRPAIDVARQHDSPQTLIYFDPPYVAETRDVRRDYAHEMTDADHEALLAAARELAGMVAISGYRCRLYDEALAGWKRCDRPTLADGARPRTESLWLNPAIQEAAYAKPRSLFEETP